MENVLPLAALMKVRYSYMGELTDATLPSYINGSLLTPSRSAAVKTPLFLAHGLSDDNVHHLLKSKLKERFLLPLNSCRFTP